MRLQPHYITRYYTTLITLNHTYSCNYKRNCHQIALHDTTLIALHYTATTTTLPYTTLHYTKRQHATLQCTTLITPHHSYNCNCNYTTLITQGYNYNSTTLHYNYSYNYNCTTPHYIQQLRWGDHCKQCNHSRKHNSNHLSVHQWIRSAIRDSQQPTLPIGFLFWKLPPSPCAVLLVHMLFPIVTHLLWTHYIYYPDIICISVYHLYTILCPL